jgi:hypothetical protein
MQKVKSLKALTYKQNAILNWGFFSRYKMPPKKRKPLGLDRTSAHAKRLKARQQTDEGWAENAAESLAAYHARSQSEEHSEQGASTSREKGKPVQVDPRKRDGKKCSSKENEARGLRV